MPAGIMRGFESGDEGMTLFAIGGNPAGDADMQQGWWAED